MSGRVVVLINGLLAVGKTSTAILLARRLGFAAVDLDDFASDDWKTRNARGEILSEDEIALEQVSAVRFALTSVGNRDAIVSLCTNQPDVVSAAVAFGRVLSITLKVDDRLILEARASSRGNHFANPMVSEFNSLFWERQDEFVFSPYVVDAVGSIEEVVDRCFRVVCDWRDG